MAANPASGRHSSSLLHPRQCRLLAYGGACLRTQTILDAYCYTTAVTKKARRSARFCLTHHNDPTLPLRLGTRPQGNSKKVSLLEGESGLKPARKTYPLRYEPCRTAGLAEAARGTKCMYVCMFLTLAHLKNLARGHKSAEHYVGRSEKTQKSRKKGYAGPHRRYTNSYWAMCKLNY